MYKKLFEGKTAAFFDLDGTIIDSLPYWHEAYQKVLSSLTPDYINVKELKRGTYSMAIWKNLLENYGIKTDLKIADLVSKTNQAYLDVFNKAPLEVRDGFWELLDELKTERNFKIALISNSDRVVVDRVLEAMSIKDNVFDLTICGDEVRYRKPSPDIYQAALKNLGVKNSEAIAFEDSLSGAESAHKAGIEQIIIWSTEIPERDYPKTALEFFQDFTPLPGNLDKYYYEYLKEQIDNP